MMQNELKDINGNKVDMVMYFTNIATLIAESEDEDFLPTEFRTANCGCCDDSQTVDDETYIKVLEEIRNHFNKIIKATKEANKKENGEKIE